jgi:type II secretory pathway component PulK
MVDDGVKINLLTELHQRMSDEEYGRVAQFLTVYGDKKININTASLEVLNSMGFIENNARAVIDLRQRRPFDKESILPYLPPNLTVSQDNFTSNTFTFRSFATVGNYTKQIEAVVLAAAGASPAILYWRAL